MPFVIEGPELNHTLIGDLKSLNQANGAPPTPQPSVVTEYDLHTIQEDKIQATIDALETPESQDQEIAESQGPLTNGNEAPKHVNGSSIPEGGLENTHNGQHKESVQAALTSSDSKESDVVTQQPDAAGSTRPPPLTIEEKVEKILDVLARYRIKSSANKAHEWQGRGTVAMQLRGYVQRDEVVRLVIPAFPFKSPNRISKVLGSLPDKAEEVALMHLNGLCAMIKEIHAPGAEVLVVSDGLMYNDLLGVTDLDVWRYSEALRNMAKENGCVNIAFYRLKSLLDLDPAVELTEEIYLEQAPRYRQLLVDRYSSAGFDADQFIKESKDALLTYRGYIKFLEKDLEHDPVLAASSNRKKESEKIAKAMIVRGKAFAAAIQHKFADQIRLSIHASAADASKLSVSLIPQQGSCSMTPWHSSLVRGVNGSITMSHSLRVPALTHELILQNGQPSYFREKSPLFDWPGMDVRFDYLYPTGILVTPTNPKDAYSLQHVQMQKVRGLAEKCSPVVLRGFRDTNDERVFKAKAYDAGDVLPWTFGVMQKVKDAGRKDRMGNNVVSSEAMPMHYDGIFKFVTKIDADGRERKESNPPRFQYFTAVTTAPVGSGYTLFANSRLFFQHLPPEHDAEALKRMTWSCQNAGFWDNYMPNLPLVVPHPVDGAPCVRWHEPWPMWRTKFAHCAVAMENAEQKYVALVDSMLYDRRVCLYLSWEKGDVVVSDNFNMLHTRTAFDGECDRELWRIHFD